MKNAEQKRRIAFLTELSDILIEIHNYPRRKIDVNQQKPKKRGRRKMRDFLEDKT